VTVASFDAPLVEPGGITDERPSSPGLPRAWRPQTVASGTFYAYLLNNYWHTNYKADQAGSLTFRFLVHPHAADPEADLRRLSAEVDHPLLVGDAPTGARTQAPPGPGGSGSGAHAAATARQARPVSQPRHDRRGLSGRRGS